MPQTKHAIEAKLASSMGHRDEQPNICLAEDIVHTGDANSVASLIDILTHSKQALRNDAIKVLYEIGKRKPILIADHYSEFTDKTQDKNNRIVWGAFTALATLADDCADLIFRDLEKLMTAADKASVIAKDQMVNILTALHAHDPYRKEAAKALLTRLEVCAVNQLPAYAEKTAALPLSEANSAALKELLTVRLNEAMPASKQKRIQPIISKV